MPTIVRLAKTTGELNDVLETRYQAVIETGRKLGGLFPFTRRVLDHFDILPTTLNTIAYRAGQPVATLRAVEYNPEEALLNYSYDFSETMSNLGGSGFIIDMFSMRKDCDFSDQISTQLLKMVLSLLSQRNIANAAFVCPEFLRAGADQLGFKSVAGDFHSEVLGLKVCPMVIDVSIFFKHMMETIVDREIIRFQEVFYSTIFEPGEVLVVEGERGSTAYLIEEGEVEVLIQKGDALISISTISKGHLIGEVAMVTNETRTASLIAKSVTSCISFDRHDFIKLMYSQPHRSLDIFKIFSKRLTESNRKLAEARG